MMQANEKQQRAAIRAFVPFVARLIEGAPLVGIKPQVPLSGPASLTEEVITAVRGILNAGIWQHLVHSGGWRMLPYADPAEEKPRRGRIWQTNVQLTFTMQSMELLLTAFNTQGAPSKKLGLRDRDSAGNGDLLLEHLLWKSVREATGRMSTNPFALLAKSNFTDDETSDGLGRLLEPDLVGLLPWLGNLWVGAWGKNERERWQGVGTLKLIPSTQGQERILGDWIDRLRSAERPDLLIFFFDYFLFVAEAFRSRRMWKKWLDPAVNHLPLHACQERAEEWAELLGLIERIEGAYRDTLDIHPIDRMAPERVFIDRYKERNFADVTNRIRALRKEIRPVVGG